MRKKFLASLISLAVVASAVLLFNFMSTSSSAASLPRDCGSNSIIDCGATSPAELKAFYKANITRDLPVVYAHYGITSAMINSVTDANMGDIHKDGTVTLNGKLVATDANSIGRKDVYHPSTKLVINGTTYYQHIPKNTFGVSSIKAYIFLDSKGRFIAAILTSCANPFAATPIPLPPTPPPVPTPPTPPTPPPAPTPTYKCDTLSATKITNNQYTFVAQSSVTNGAAVTGYTYNFGDGTTSPLLGSSATHTYLNPGSYTVIVTATFKAGNNTVTATSPSCEAKITIPVPTYTCDELGARVIKLEDRSYAYDLSYTVTNGATLKTVDFDFGDTQGRQGVTSAELQNVTHVYAVAGTYVTTATLHFNVGSAVKDIKCETSLTISPEMCTLIPSLPKTDLRCTPCTVPGKEQYPAGSDQCKTIPVTPPTTSTPTLLPHTGPMEVISGSLGLGSLIAAGSYWFASRRSLLGALLNR